MKKLYLMLTALLALSLPQAAQALNVEGMYAGGFAGVNFIQNYKHDDVTFSFKPGFIIGGHAGYRWCEGFRGEGEISYRYNKLDWAKEEHEDKHHLGGNVHTWSFMANGYYDIETCWCLFPYVGAGIGYDSMRHKTCKGHSKADKSGFAWQLIAGSSMPIDECAEVGLEYRFHQGPKKNFYNHAVDARVNFFF